MITLCMVWRRDDPKQPAMEAILTGAKHYRNQKGRAPNFINLPPGFLGEEEIEKLRKCFTVAVNAPKYFKDEIWLGVMTPATTPLQLPPNVGEQIQGESQTEGRMQ